MGETKEFWHDDNDIPEWIKQNDMTQDWMDKQDYEYERKNREMKDMTRNHDMNNGDSARSIKRKPGRAAMSALHPNDPEGGREWRQTLGMEIN